MLHWITTYIASYLEDVADLSENFTHHEALVLGFAGASVIKNIVDRFLELTPTQREELIAGLKGQVAEEDSFVQKWVPSKPTLPICQAGVDLIKEFEGCRLEAYQCPAGRWTVGYGHTTGVKEGDTITQAEADILLLEDIKEAAATVRACVTVLLTENQHAALTSFVFNLGRANFEKSTLLKRLNAGEKAAVPEELNRWVYAGSQKLPGLIRRRDAEGKLFMRA